MGAVTTCFQNSKPVLRDECQLVSYSLEWTNCSLLPRQDVSWIKFSLSFRPYVSEEPNHCHRSPGPLEGLFVYKFHPLPLRPPLALLGSVHNCLRVTHFLVPRLRFVSSPALPRSCSLQLPHRSHWPSTPSACTLFLSLSQPKPRNFLPS